MSCELKLKLLEKKSNLFYDVKSIVQLSINLNSISQFQHTDISQDSVFFCVFVNTLQYVLRTRMFSSVTGLQPLDTNGNPTVTIKNVSRHCQMFTGSPDHA